jgi:hypothetical protein
MIKNADEEQPSVWVYGIEGTFEFLWLWQFISALLCFYLPEPRFKG